MTQKIMSGVGNHPMLSAALVAGADAVYLGVKQFNMRMAAGNFELSELPKIVQKCHEKNVEVFLTVNSIIYEDELEKAEKFLKEAKASGVDAIICHDMAIIKLCKALKIPINLSTQASVSNSEAALEYEKMGISTIVLARECTVEQIAEIKKQLEQAKSKLKIEAFCHGALCISQSGRCFLSGFLYGKSANRGECLHACRRAFRAKDMETGDELEVHNNYILSPRDLCTIPFLDKLPVDYLKIEGRNRTPEYVKTTIEVYKEALRKIANNEFTEEYKQQAIEKLKTVYNRDFCDGFYTDRTMGLKLTEEYGSSTTVKKRFVGIVKNFFKKIAVAEVKIQSGKLKTGDKVLITGNSTGAYETKVNSMQFNHKNIDTADKGQSVAIKLDKEVRPNDRVFILH